MDSKEFFIKLRHKTISGQAGALALRALYYNDLMTVNAEDHPNNWQKVDPSCVKIDFAKLRCMIENGSLLQLRNMGKKSFNLICMCLGIQIVCVKKTPVAPVPRCNCCGQRLPKHLRV